MNKYELICTIGPSCKESNILKNLKGAGVDIFRVNMSHTSIDQLESFYKISKKIDIKLGIDTEGAQIRTKIRNEGNIKLKEGIIFKIPSIVENNFENELMHLYPSSVFNSLEEGMKIRLDFNGALAKIIKKTNSFLELECISSGLVGNNKGVDVLNHKINLPDFTEKDLLALNFAKENDINEIFISFCKSEEAVIKTKDITNNARVTSKIESKLSIHNLENICKVSDALLIDRGDLSREINIMDIPFAQRGIVQIAASYKIPCFVATNVLESLINGNLPTRAELNDIVGTLEMGASGIVLAAETAIGKKPILCAEIVKELIHRFNLYKSGLLFADLDRNEITDQEMKIWLNR